LYYQPKKKKKQNPLSIQLINAIFFLQIIFFSENIQGQKKTLKKRNTHIGIILKSVFSLCACVKPFV